MAKMIKKKCQNCKQPMQVRMADHKRGWGKFCSKSCKAKQQEARTGQYKSWLNSERQRQHEDLADGSIGLMDGHGQWD